MQFKKKKKKHKNNEVDEELIKEQERLFNAAQDLYMKSQSSELVMESPSMPQSLERFASSPMMSTQRLGAEGDKPAVPMSKPEPGVLVELEKKLSERCVVDSTDFDALGTKS